LNSKQIFFFEQENHAIIIVGAWPEIHMALTVEFYFRRTNSDYRISISYNFQMVKNPALIFILSLSLLFSMTEIYKVTLLGFTVLTDSDKAAHFCTCTGCSHSQDNMQKNNDTGMDEHGLMQHQQNDNSQAAHCAMNGTEAGEAAYCACKTSPEKESPILFNSLDKVALLTPVKTNRPSEKKRVLSVYQNRDEKSLSKDVFHPPKRA